MKISILQIIEIFAILLNGYAFYRNNKWLKIQKSKYKKELTTKFLMEAFEKMPQEISFLHHVINGVIISLN